MTHLHIDATIGAAGDMLLAALLDAGASLDAVRSAVAQVLGDEVVLGVERVHRAGIAAARLEVQARPGPSRTWREIRELVPDGAFRLLAEAEAAVHGIETDDVHFHEVGAADSIADIVGVTAAIADLGVASVSCTRVGVGTGIARTGHGAVPVPAPAVAELLRGVPTWGGPLPVEACTPTAAALLRAFVTSWGPQPPMTVRAVGTGAGSYDDPSTANVTRVFLGDAAGQPDGAWLLETNVDDLDPRLWPHVIGRLLAAGASDAWLTPILMKKGRPAHTLSVLVRESGLEPVRDAILSETSAIGMRLQRVDKYALPRQIVEVEVLGESIAVKVAVEDGEIRNVQPEWEDVRRVAEASGLPAKVVLQLAVAAAMARREA